MDTEILTIEPHVNLNTIKIWNPRWHDRVVLIDKRKIKDHNKIVFTKSKALAGKEFYLSAVRAKKYPTESNGKIDCRAVPLDDLREMKQAKEVW